MVNKAAKEKERLTQADILVSLGSRALLFHAENYDSYAAVDVNGHREVWPLRSRGFRQWLVREFYMATGKAPTNESLSQALNVLEARAVFDGKVHRLNLRVAEYNGAFWYDLADSEWRAVKITPDRWELVERPAVLFRRYQNTASQVEPQRGGDLKEFHRLVNLKTDDEKVLLLSYLVAALVPEIPKPILVISGEKGAGKSTLLRMLRALIDPAVEPLLIMRNEEKDLALQLTQNYAPFFDNISSLSQWQSDTLCRAATGAGFLTRVLFTDEEMKIYRIKRAVGMSVIHPVGGAPDFQDRLLTVELERIDKKSRRQEVELLAEFERLRAHFFGAMLDALVKAMSIKPCLQIPELPRMADFAVWGAAAAEALGLGADRFLAAYWRNIGQVNERLLESHPVAAAVVSLLRDVPTWQGTPAELLDTLEKVAETEKINIHSKIWPKSANALTRRLKEVASNLLEAGVMLEFVRSSQARNVVLRKVCL